MSARNIIGHFGPDDKAPIERGKIRENWVLVDILDAYRQLGLDVFARLREFNKARR